MRVVPALLLLTALAVAQSVEQIADEASRPGTGPKQRGELMQELMKLEGGPAALARVALDKARDPEVVHAAVEVLLDEGLAAEHLERICALLLSERHRKKVEERLYRYAQDHPEPARDLVQQLAILARDPNGDAEQALDRQLAAVRALGKIPLREAVEQIAIVWSGSEGALAARCSVELKDVLEAVSGDHALQLLRERPFASYTDLVKEVSSKRAEELRKALKMVARLREWAFQHATAEQVFKTLDEGDPNLKPFAAERALKLAEAKQYGKQGAGHFAGEVVECLLKELPAGANRTTIKLVETLKELYATKALGKETFPKAAEVRDALRAGSRGGEDQAKFATLAIGLLREMGAGAASVVADYASHHKSEDVRQTAVRALGALAKTGDKTLKAQVGVLLARLLQSDPPRSVLSQILFNLQTAPSDEAIESIQKLLFPSDPKMALGRNDAIYCIELLAASPSATALETLEKLAREASDVTLRIDAVDRGLVGRTHGGAESGGVLDFLQGLVRDPKQAEVLRLGVLTAIGAKGNREAAPMLGVLASDEKLDAKVRAEATRQRLVLAARIVRGNGEVTSEVLDAVATILAEEIARPGADLAAMLLTARAAVQVADRNTVKARGCRSLYAQLLSRQPKPKPSAVRAAWKDAADKAAGDGLTPTQQIKVLEAYRALLLATKPPAGGEGALIKETNKTNMRLCALAEKKGDVQGSFRYWLAALAGAVEKLKDRKAADVIVGRKPAGEPAGDLASRWETLSKLMEGLPKAG